MRRLFFLTIAFLIWLNPAAGQRASDVLERGITIKQNQKLFLRYDAGALKYDIAEDHPDNFLTIPDSVLFLPKNIGVNVYIRPLNPLNYSITDELTFIPDQIESKATEVYDQISGLLGKMDKKSEVQNRNLIRGQEKRDQEKPVEYTCKTKLQYLINIYTSIKDKLNSGADFQKQIIASFQQLKSLSFEEAGNTRDSIDQNGTAISKIKEHFDSIKILLDSLKIQIKKYSCKDPKDTLIVKHVLTDLLFQVTTEYERQKGRYQNLKKAFDLVDKACKMATVSKDGLEWCVFIKEVEVQRGKISKLIVKINQSGYIWPDSGEMVANLNAEKVKRVVSFRKFNLFIPEVSAGVAYTNLNFPKYSTETDAQGNLVVADAGNENFKRLSINAMLNIVGFIPNSMLHPFFQVGVGVNANYPTILTGIGLRLNFVPLKRLALAFGFASTWIQQLDKLKVGDKVSGEADVSKDLIYQFNWPPKPYIAIQYNF